ncbi:MAG TPA: formylmethanofuran dehydrogenase subunit C [Vicinamibacterales bacterium]|nr:formylmethanofuran dehydrogenase subunit C [Vicinamibacterales bacterium]
MSDWITLTPRLALDGPIALSVHPERYAELAEHDIAALPAIGRDREQLPLGEMFTVKGGRSTRVRLEGATPHLHSVGAGMLWGELVVDGDLGSYAGAGIRGGTMHVRGTVGDAAGLAMMGGALRIDGDAGDRLGANIPGAAKGMSGGEIIVRGSAGADAGARLRRGLIVVSGDLLRDGGRSMIAGSIVVLGRCGENAGRGNKRGSIVACGGITVPATYRYATTYQPPHVRVTLTYLRRQYGLAIDQALIAASYRRYCGDAGEPGKGEILERVI